MNMDFILNDKEVSISADPGSSTLGFLREERGLKSVKSGCGEGECGACTVLLGSHIRGKLKYKNVASCLLPLGELNGKHIVTLEGINMAGLSPVQESLVREGAIQCGFCTPGFVMSLTGFFLSAEDLTKENIINAIDGNICRCTGYFSIKRASEKVLSEVIKKIRLKERVLSLVDLSIIPEYFTSIPRRLHNIKKTGTGIDNASKTGKKRVFIGGGTDLLVGYITLLKSSNPQFISEIENISDIYADDKFIHIGAGATVEEIKDSEILNIHFPEISDFMYLISSTIIRNSATLGGNIVNASPIGDLSVLFLALDPVLTIEGESGVREVDLKYFFKGYKVMDLKRGELILRLKIPLNNSKKVLTFEKISRRKYFDIASCNSASCFYLEGDRIIKCDLSAGGVAPVPLYLKKTSNFLEGRKADEDTLSRAIKISMDEIAPISDVRGSAEYKKKLLKRIIRAHFNKVFDSIDGEGIEK